ncbi:MAG: hypothetical protein KG012_05395 [Deltaproteobacteria bacterium]|nr:hypothetical protein [Deltaproteobacteria bacterium]
MKVGFAVQTNEGMESRVYDHFGSAPAFIIVDTEGKEVLTINNKDLHHLHGACNPIMALDGKSVDAMVVGGIGAGALTKSDTPRKAGGLMSGAASKAVDPIAKRCAKAHLSCQIKNVLPFHPLPLDRGCIGELALSEIQRWIPHIPEPKDVPL